MDRSAEKGDNFCMRRMGIGVAVLSFTALMSGCMAGYRKAINEDVDRDYQKIFLTDFDTAWQSTLEALKSSSLDVSNREAGFVRTRWMDNTAQKNFADSFGAGRFYLKAQFRIRVTLGKVFYNGRPAIKVNIQKEQMVQQDVLEGWRTVVTDGVDENTLLYRVGRLIVMSSKRQIIEEQRTKEQLKETAAPESPAGACDVTLGSIIF